MPFLFFELEWLASPLSKRRLDRKTGQDTGFNGGDFYRIEVVLNYGGQNLTKWVTRNSRE